MRIATPNRLTFWTLRVLVAISALEFVGCNRDLGPPRYPVSGAVKIDGQPLDAGTITFLPETNQPAVSAEFSAGNYRINRSVGPAAGRYQVEIVSVKPTGKIIKHPDLPTETIEEVRNIVPQQYNTRTTLQVVVKPDTENIFDFELFLREKPAVRRR